MHIHMISFNQHSVLAHTIDGLLISADMNPKAAVLPELLGAFPTKAVNDTALKESISLCCSIHLQRQDGKKQKKPTSLQNLVMEPTQPCT